MNSDDDLQPEVPRDQRDQRCGGSGRHPVSIGHLVMGVAFLGLTLVWALVEFSSLNLGDNEWLLPAPWLVAGLVGLVATALRGRRTPSSSYSASSSSD